jgi:hypothetical protein
MGIVEVDKFQISVPYFLFSVAYCLLWKHGCDELKSKEFQFVRTHQNIKYFKFVDGLFAVLFFSYALFLVSELDIFSRTLIYKTDVVSSWYSLIHSKDILIAMCTSLYLLSSKMVSKLIATKSNDTYAKYLTHVDLNNQFHYEMGNSLGTEKVWFDYGSGTGRRLHEVMQLFYNKNVKPAYKIIFYDKDVNIYDKIDIEVECWLRSKRIQYEFLMTPAKYKSFLSSLNKADIVLLSHLAYDPHKVNVIITKLKTMKIGALIVIRVTGATGLFRAISMMFSHNLMRPSFRHAVPKILIRALDCLGFKQIKKVRVQQKYNLTDVNATSDLANWCEFAYGDTVGGLVKDYLDEIQSNGITVLPNDDEIYILQKI